MNEWNHETHFIRINKKIENEIEDLKDEIEDLLEEWKERDREKKLPTLMDTPVHVLQCFFLFHWTNQLCNTHTDTQPHKPQSQMETK